MFVTMPNFYMSCEVPNLKSHSYKASALPIEPSPSSNVDIFIMSYRNCLPDLNEDLSVSVSKLGLLLL